MNFPYVSCSLKRELECLCFAFDLMGHLSPLIYAKYGPTLSGTLYKGYLDEVGCASFKFALGCSFGGRGMHLSKIVVNICS